MIALVLLAAVVLVLAAFPLMVLGVCLLHRAQP